MSAAAPDSASSQRPRQVTLGAWLAVIGSVVAVVAMVGSMQQLHSAAVTDLLREVLAKPKVADAGLTLETTRTILKYTIMTAAVVAVTSLVLGLYVLRRHRGARIALSVLGVVVALFMLLGGPSGWPVTAYVAVSLALLWSRPARAWFDQPASR